MVVNLTPKILISTLFFAITASFVVYTVKRKKRQNRIPTEWKKVGYIKQLYLFPIKSFHYMEIDGAECTEVGFRLLNDSSDEKPQLRDRSFVVYGEINKEVKNGRGIPALVKIHVSIHDKHHIALDAPQMNTLLVKIPDEKITDESHTHVMIGKEKIEAIDCGDEAAKWLSKIIVQKDSGYRLGYYKMGKRRDLLRHDNLGYYKNMSDASTGLFSDYTSILIINQKSVDDFLTRAPNSDVKAINFRPNILVDGHDLQAYEEDNWDWVKIGDVIMRNVKECTRCVFTITDQETGKRNSEREPLTTLSKYRMSKGPERAPVMGIHLEVKKTGIIRSGDDIHIGFS